MINATFTSRVGVSPGTTTVALNDGGPEQFVCLGNGIGPCLPEPASPYMTHSGSGAILPDGGHPATSEVEVAMVPYGTESTLKDRPMLLGSAPWNMSWKSFLTIITVSLAGGAGLAYLASRR